MNKSVLEELRAAGLRALIEDGELYLEGAVTDELLHHASRNKPQILADLAEEEVHAGWRTRSPK